MWRSALASISAHARARFGHATGIVDLWALEAARLICSAETRSSRGSERLPEASEGGRSGKGLATCPDSAGSAGRLNRAGQTARVRHYCGAK